MIHKCVQLIKVIRRFYHINWRVRYICISSNYASYRELFWKEICFFCKNLKAWIFVLITPGIIAINSFESSWWIIVVRWSEFLWLILLSIIGLVLLSLRKDRQSSLNSFWNWWGSREVSTLCSETVFVGDISYLNWSTIGSGVSIRSLNNLDHFFQITYWIFMRKNNEHNFLEDYLGLSFWGTLRLSRFRCGDTIVSFITPTVGTIRWGILLLTTNTYELTSRMTEISSIVDHMM